MATLAKSKRWSDKEIQRAYKDFRVFLFILWKEISLPSPTKLQIAIAETLMYPPRDRLIIQGFRGVAKSFITCAFVVWRLWQDRNLRVLIVSASKDRADSNAIFVRRIIQTVDFLDELLPTKGQRDTQNIFDVGGCIVDISPSVKSIGISGQLTGSRADLLLADDVEVVNNSATQVQRDKLSELVREFDAILKPGGQIICLGTPQVEATVYLELEKRGYTSRIFPVLYPSNQKEIEFYGERLAPVIAQEYTSNPLVYAGTPTDPLRFTEEEIDKRKLSYGKAGFALQYMLNTNLSDIEKYPLRCQDFIVSDLDIEATSLLWNWATGQQQRQIDVPCVGLKGDFFYQALSRSEETMPYTGCVMSIDSSGRGADETAFAIVKYLNGYLFVMEIGGYKEGYSDAVISALATKAKYYGVNDVVVEANFGDGMFTKLITPVFNKIHPCTIHEVKHSKQKELRIIDTLEPLLSRHKIVLNKQIILDDFQVYERDQRYSLFYQLTRIAKQRGCLAHDDRLDALAIACAFWVDVMDKDAQDGADDLLAEQLEMWMDGSLIEIMLTPATKRQQLQQGTIKGQHMLGVERGKLLQR